MATTHPYLQKLKGKLAELHGSKVIAGVQAESGINFHGDTVSSSNEMQKIAWVHEYGVDIDVTPKMRAWLHRNGIHLKADTKKIHIPERSYIRQAQAEGKASLNAVYNTHIKLLIEDICCKGWMSNPLLKQRDSQLIRSGMKRFSGKGEISIRQAA